MSETTELQRAVETLTKSIESLRLELVRKDVYASDQRALAVQLQAMSKDIGDVKAAADKLEERRAADRRLIIASFIAPLLLLLLNLYIASQTGSA
jgi:hypothetical protein